MQTQRITIDPITRLEGHGKIEIFLDDRGEVERAYFQVPELRGFETFCIGRPAEDMLQITSRICGVCPTAHHMAATKALDDLYQVQPPPTALKIRDLTYNAFLLEDHALHVYILGGPDFIVGPETPKELRNIVGVIQKVGVDVGKRVKSISDIKALLFDLDGTLLDSFPVHYEVYKIMLERLGIQINKEKFLSTYSPDWYKTYEAMELPKEKWELANSYWLEEAEKHSPELFPNVSRILLSLSKYFALGLVTSGSRTRVMNDLERTDIKHLFKTIVTGDDIKNPKPSPEGLNLALSDLNLNANEAIYIGDTIIDFEMAKAVKVLFLGVNSEFKKWLNGKQTAHVEIYKAEGKYYGKIVWLKEPVYPSDDKKGMAGKQKVDRETPTRRSATSPSWAWSSSGISPS